MQKTLKGLLILSILLIIGTVICISHDINVVIMRSIFCASAMCAVICFVILLLKTQREINRIYEEELNKEYNSHVFEVKKKIKKGARLTDHQIDLEDK